MWKRHVVYESRPHTVIITLGNKLYMMMGSTSDLALPALLPN